MPSLPLADRRPVLGVLGGMGPASTAEFLARLVRATPARTDQEHLRTLVWSDVSIPDRSEGLLGRGADPTAALIDGVRRLVDAGSEVIVMPCNTAHAYLEPIRAASGVPVLSMVEAASDQAIRTMPPGARAGLLATTGTVVSRVYHDAFAQRGVGVLVPDNEQQEAVAAAIRAVKAGDADGTAGHVFGSVADRFAARGASHVIAGCTEITLVLRPEHAQVRLIDPVDAIIERILRWAGLPLARATA